MSTLTQGRYPVKIILPSAYP